MVLIRSHESVSAVRTPRTQTRTDVRPAQSMFEAMDNSGTIVIVYDNDTNTYEQVVSILQQATGCTAEEAYIEAWEIDHLGKSVVHHGSRQECERAAGIIRQIGIRVEVTEE